MQDSDLIALLQTEPERGFTALVRQYGGYVYTIAANQLRSAGTAEDIEEAVSDVFALFYQWMQSHDLTGASLRALLAVIAKRHSINRFHALTKHPADEPLDTLLTEPASDAPDERILLMQTVKSLGQPDSEIILRRYYFGQSSKEIGAALGLKPNTVDQRISRGLKRLREILE